jgi:hypothetical protein
MGSIGVPTQSSIHLRETLSKALRLSLLVRQSHRPRNLKVLEEETCSGFLHGVRYVLTQTFRRCLDMSLLFPISISAYLPFVRFRFVHLSSTS